MRKKMVAGNWKMFTNSAGAKALAAAVVQAVAGDDRVDVVVAPPFPYLAQVGEVLKGSQVALSAQDAYVLNEGAFTGEVSPTMLMDVGCTYVIIGHSERRHKIGETDALTHEKVKACLTAGLKVILCVGETLQERMNEKTEEVILRQFTTAIANIPDTALRNLLLAYEPVWAIGTGHNATPEQAQKVHAYLRGKIDMLWGQGPASKFTILYGGSVTGANAAELFREPDVDGGLIGGASLSVEKFLPIIQAARG